MILTPTKISLLYIILQGSDEHDCEQPCEQPVKLRALKSQVKLTFNSKSTNNHLEYDSLVIEN